MKDEKMLECAKVLKEYCKGFGENCAGCLFYGKDTDIVCALGYTLPYKWGVEDLSKEEAIELLEEMRENISGLDENKVTALTMAIKALEG